MGLGGFGGPARRAPPTLLEGAGQAPPLTGCLRPIHTQYAVRWYVWFREYPRPLTLPASLPWNATAIVDALCSFVPDS